MDTNGTLRGKPEFLAGGGGKIINKQQQWKAKNVNSMETWPGGELSIVQWPESIFQCQLSDVEVGPQVEKQWRGPLATSCADSPKWQD